MATSLNDQNPERSTQAKTRPQTQPSSPELSLGELAQGAIATYFHQAVAYEGPVLADADPEDLHQMRVNLRRLRSAVVAFAVAIDLPKAANDRAIGQLAGILGALRDLDVLAEVLAKLRRDRQGYLGQTDRAALRQCQKSLKADRRQAFNRVRTTLGSRAYRQFKTRLGQWCNQPRFQAPAAWPGSAVIPDLLAPVLATVLAHPAWLLGGDVDSLSDRQWATLHDLRKRAKRLRYCLALFEPHLGRSSGSQVDRATIDPTTTDRAMIDRPYPNGLGDVISLVATLQTCLGDLQDWSVLQDFFRRSIGRRWEERAPGLAAGCRADRDRFWSGWQQERLIWLNPTDRQAIRQSLTH